MVKEREYNVDKYAAEKEKRDNEIFMRSIEQDFDLRCRIKVYKDHENNENENNIAITNDDGDLPPPIPDHELIDEFAEMKISKKEQLQTNDDDDQEVINTD
eukprot:277505_1